MGDSETRSAALQPGELWYHELLDLHAFLIGFSEVDDDAPVFQFLDGDVVDTGLISTPEGFAANLIYKPIARDIERERPRITNACSEDDHTFYVEDPEYFLNFRLQCADCGLSVEALVMTGQRNVIDLLPVRCTICDAVIPSEGEWTVVKDAYACPECAEQTPRLLHDRLDHVGHDQAYSTED